MATTAGDLTIRFTQVPHDRPHYESVFVTATDPTSARAVWIRYTVHKPPGRDPTGSVWFTEFTAAGPRAAKISDRVASEAGRAVLVGDHGSVSRDGAVGAVAGPGLEARWGLTFTGSERPLTYLPHQWMYSAPFSRTKATSPRPDMQLDGTIEINGETTEVTGWRGMLGHNWGTEHARRWIWLRGAGFSQSPSTWLDVVIGRVRLGPLESPWIASGVVSLAGERHSVGGVGRRPVVRPRPNGAEVTLRGPDLSVQVSVEAPLERCVGWEYADPSGDLHHVRNCSSADMRLEVQGAVVQVLTSTYGAVYELGTPSRQPGLTLQPFPDT